MSILKRKIRLVPTIEELDNDDKNRCKEGGVLRRWTGLQNLLFVPPRKVQNLNHLHQNQRRQAMSRPDFKRNRVNLIPGTKIIRNYAKALCAFAHSNMATPYLKGIMERSFEGKDEIKSFQKHIKVKKRKAGSIDSLKGPFNC